MKLFIVTQDENVYLPRSIAAVCEAFPGDVTAIVSAPAMSTHGGAVKGFIRHVRFFGFRGSAILGMRVIAARLRAFRKVDRKGPFDSMAQVARAYGVPYVHVDRLKGDDFMAAVDRYGGDLLISISCPQIIGKAIRDRFPMGAINLHGSPLPRYRGLMPAFWVLRNGEKETAITVHDLDAKLDDGAILAQEIDPDHGRRDLGFTRAQDQGRRRAAADRDDQAHCRRNGRAPAEPGVRGDLLLVPDSRRQARVRRSRKAFLLVARNRA